MTRPTSSSIVSLDSTETVRVPELSLLNVGVVSAGDQELPIGTPGASFRRPISTSTLSLTISTATAGRTSRTSRLHFNQMTRIAANEPVSAFDYNGNGRIDFAEVFLVRSHSIDMLPTERCRGQPRRERVPGRDGDANI